MPRKITVTFADGTSHVYQNVPDNVTPEQTEQRVSRQFPGKKIAKLDGGRGAPPRQRGTGIGPVDFMLDAINETALGAVEGAYNTGAFFTDPLLRLFAGEDTLRKVQAQRKNMFDAASQQVSTRELPINRFVGSVIAPAGVVSKGAKLLAPVVQQIPKVGPKLARVTQAAGSGGIGSGRTAAQTAKIPIKERAIDLAERVVGGAVGGLAGGQLMGSENATQDALIGGALPIGFGAVGGAVGKAVDAGAFVGQLVGLFRSDKVQAAKLFREALGDNLEAARQVFANLLPDDQRLARRVLIDEGVEPDAFMAMGANMERLRPTQTRLIEEGENAAARQGLEQAAGVPSGGTLTDVRAATRSGREEVSNAMSPAREGAFAQSAEASNADVLAREAFRRKAEADALAAREAADAQRLTGASTFFGDSPAFTRGADAATDRATAAAQTAEEQAAIAQQMEDLVAQAAAEGVPPLNGAPLVAQLRRMATQPGTRIDKVDRPALLDLANTIQRNMDENGMVSALDMYQLRKRGVSNAISAFENKILEGNIPRTGTSQQSSKLLGEVQTLIDDALGEPFKNYLKKSAEGYAAVNRQQIAGEALRRFDPNNPKPFLDLVGRNDPDTVGRITQGGAAMEDISNVFAMDPQRLAALMDAQNLLAGRNRMGELTRSGGAKAIDIMNIETPSKMRAATNIALSTVPSGRIALSGVDQLTGNFMRPKISARLAEGFMPGQSANTLLNTYSTPLMVDDVLSRLPPNIRNMLAQSARQSFTSDQR